MDGLSAAFFRLLCSPGPCVLHEYPLWVSFQLTELASLESIFSQIMPAVLIVSEAPYSNSLIESKIALPIMWPHVPKATPTVENFSESWMVVPNLMSSSALRLVVVSLYPLIHMTRMLHRSTNPFRPSRHLYAVLKYYTRKLNALTII